MHIPQGKRFNTEVSIQEELRNNDTVGEIIIQIKKTPLFVQGNPIRVKADSVINRNPEK